MNIGYSTGIPSLKAKRKKFGIGSLIFLLLFGAVFAGAGIVAIRSSSIDKSWPRTSGTVVDSSSDVSDGSTTYTPIVTYSVNGQSYKVSGGSGSSAHPTIGSHRQVAYNPTQPNNAKVVESKTVMGFLYIFPTIGIALIILAPILFVKSVTRSQKINSLVQSGIKQQGIISNIQLLNSDNSSNYRIEVSATNTSGAVQTYVSDMITGIGGLSMVDFRSHPIPMDVYIDPSNPQNYYVDVSDIPALTPERIGELIQSAVHKNQPVQ